MASEKICPCDGASSEFTITNPPGRVRIAYRVGDFVAFRHALLRSAVKPPDHEVALDVWRPTASGDLGVQMLEWWAYLADILTFYNERIANEMFLRTASLPESLDRLIRTLGYRPRPGIAAHGQVVALVGGHRPVTLPRGFALDSKPGPGETPQTFELDASTTVSPQGTLPAMPPAYLLAPASGVFLLAGTSVSFAAGAVLLLSSRTGAFTPALLSVSGVATETGEDGKPRTRVAFSSTGTLPTTASARDLDMRYAAQAMAVSTIDQIAIWGAMVHLAGLARDLHAGDYVVLTTPGQTPGMRNLKTVNDVVWYANHPASQGPTTAPSAPAVPVPVLHSQLILDSDVPAGWTIDATTVRFGWRSVGTLIDQPTGVFTGSPATLLARPPAKFPGGSGAAIVIADAVGEGMAGFGASSDDGLTLTVSGLPQPPTALKPPLTVHYNLLGISRGKTVTNEVLGSGDASVADQEFVLKKSPLTYLAKGDSFVSTLAVWVNGRQWLEATSFYQQPHDAEIFVTREDEQQKTHVMFGDGVNGARLPSGAGNVVATYRYGSGAKSPRSGEITVINKPYPDLKSVQNPVAVGGGADPDPPDQIRRFAPGSVMTFGRAVSGDDYEVIAARAPGVTRAQAAWSFDPIEQRAAVKIYVGDDQNAVASAITAIAATGDPHRHVVVAAAVPIPVLIGLRVLVDSRYLIDDIRAALRVAMLDEATGIFGVRRLGVGQAVFDSEIAAACLAVPGVVATRDLVFMAKRPSGTVHDTGPRHVPGEGAFFSLNPQWLVICPEVTDRVR